MKILLCCSGGFSTSLLMEKMKESANEKGIDAEIWAVGMSEVEEELEKADIILLGPQIRYELENLEDICLEKGKKIAVIDMSDYGMMRGDKVLEKAMSL